MRAISGDQGRGVGGGVSGFPERLRKPAKSLRASEASRIIVSPFTVTPRTSASEDTSTCNKKAAA